MENAPLSEYQMFQSKMVLALCRHMHAASNGYHRHRPRWLGRH